jgi:hypothetical protein
VGHDDENDVVAGRSNPPSGDPAAIAGTSAVAVSLGFLVDLHLWRGTNLLCPMESRSGH